MQLTNRSPSGFEAQIKKPPRWFCGPNHQIVATGFGAQTGNPITTSFEGKPGETVTTGFEAKPVKTVPVVLRPNHWQTVDVGFEAQPRNSFSSSHYAWCRPHTASPDLPIVRSLSTGPVPDHPQSFALGLLLLPRLSSLPAMPLLPPAHQETSKCDSPNETKIKVKQLKCPRFKFKPHQVNDISESK
jgi:hypothetical protein